MAVLNPCKLRAYRCGQNFTHRFRNGLLVDSPLAAVPVALQSRENFPPAFVTSWENQISVQGQSPIFSCLTFTSWCLPQQSVLVFHVPPVLIDVPLEGKTSRYPPGAPEEPDTFAGEIIPIRHLLALKAMTRVTCTTTIPFLAVASVSS